MNHPDNSVRMFESQDPYTARYSGQTVRVKEQALASCGPGRVYTVALHRDPSTQFEAYESELFLP